MGSTFNGKNLLLQEQSLSFKSCPLLKEGGTQELVFKSKIRLKSPKSQNSRSSSFSGFLAVFLTLIQIPVDENSRDHFSSSIAFTLIVFIGSILQCLSYYNLGSNYPPPHSIFVKCNTPGRLVGSIRYVNWNVSKVSSGKTKVNLYTCMFPLHILRESTFVTFVWLPWKKNFFIKWDKFLSEKSFSFSLKK